MQESVLLITVQVRAHSSRARLAAWGTFVLKTARMPVASGVKMSLHMLLTAWHVLQTAEAVAATMKATMAQDHHLSAQQPHSSRGACGVQYTRAQLKATLTLMGCKTRHAHKVRADTGRPVFQSCAGQIARN